MISHDELLQSKLEDILRIAARYGAYNVRIFGSVARGEADEQRDIDFLMNMEPGRSLFDLGGLRRTDHGYPTEARGGCR